MDDTTLRVIRAAKRARKARTPNSFTKWAGEPVVIVRAGLVADYAINVYVAIMAVTAGVPVFSLTTPDGWTTVWATLLIIASVIATVCISSDAPAAAAMRPKWRVVEFVSTGAVWVFTGSYAAALHILGFVSQDDNRQTAAAVSLGLVVLPLFRWVYLTWRLGRRDIPSEKSSE